jgi:hypothetical protein
MPDEGNHLISRAPESLRCALNNKVSAEGVEDRRITSFFRHTAPACVPVENDREEPVAEVIDSRKYGPTSVNRFVFPQPHMFDKSKRSRPRA